MYPTTLGDELEPAPVEGPCCVAAFAVAGAGCEAPLTGVTGTPPRGMVPPAVFAGGVAGWGRGAEGAGVEGCDTPGRAGPCCTVGASERGAGDSSGAGDAVTFGAAETVGRRSVAGLGAVFIRAVGVVGRATTRGATSPAVTVSAPLGPAVGARPGINVETGLRASKGKLSGWNGRAFREPLRMEILLPQMMHVDRRGDENAFRQRNRRPPDGWGRPDIAQGFMPQDMPFSTCVHPGMVPLQYRDLPGLQPGDGDYRGQAGVTWSCGYLPGLRPTAHGVPRNKYVE
jgi:hypothetical protein